MGAEERFGRAIDKEQALRPVDPDVSIEVQPAGPEAGDVGVASLVDGQGSVQEGKAQEHAEQRQPGERRQEPRVWTPGRIALLVGGYLVGLLGMIELRGLFLSPDRYFLILLVPALFLGVARRYVLDFLPFIALMLVYEEARGLAHIVSPHPYYAPQLDIDRWLFGTVPTLWLQAHLWHGSLDWWQRVLSVLVRLHFIVPPTLLFLIWLVDRARYYRYALTILAVSFFGALVFALWPAAPPWMASRDGWIAHVVRIDYLPIGGGLQSSSHSWIEGHLLRNDAAAVPSLHAAYAMLVLLFLVAIDRRLWPVGLAYALGMWFAIVFFGEHYVSDALLGIAIAVLGWIVIGRLVPRTLLAGPFTAPLRSARAGPRV